MAKFIVSFKSPDAPSDAVRQAVADGNLTEKEIPKANNVCKKFFEYGEYCYVEIDTDAKTATVIPTN